MTLAILEAAAKPTTRQMVAIIRIVARAHEMDVEKFMSKDRHAPVVDARQIAMVLCRELLGASYPHIAVAFNKRDHTTVMHACKTIPDKASVDAALRKRLAALRTECRKAIDLP